ncbi:hypothetical protein IX317_000376 [Fusobacterium sp. DD29]|uniref:hypothetical protein n=1 Tax=unclassified Fusobacterium TaxID=2648384 RepID=UPI001B8B838F|nr:MULTISPECIES: hypothetical protein [unclassified Fusobacterium]MBR8748717.1 hypothetical protein [Fusobacterium sp. DD29]MBR8760931.1 hypothetical protein [Fusobacterium sp. DD25]MBR8766996.1 hypothetical protein [Fusobacterium sp. DD43]MBR8770997.1 hypothetical protein [Fusobacterium sp. DD40]MBR8775272.1 hypothetical protein [Fusobacterium sp. DD17]
MRFEDLKIELIKKRLKFIDLVRADGRSYQYLHRECSSENEKVLNELFKLLKDKF